MNDLTPARQSTNDSLVDGTSSKKLCWVCFGTEQDDEISDLVWICPCQCKGTMKWVHEECLQRWIDEKQKRSNSLRVSCSQCKTHYILRFPPANCLVRLIEQYDKLLYGSSPFVAVIVVVGSIYWCCGSYGLISMVEVMGVEDSKRILDESDPLLLIIGLPVIPIALILAKLIKWEDFLLRLWRRRVFKLPRPLSFIIDEPPVHPRANCDQVLLDPGFNDPLGCTRMICGALLLPTVSAVLGGLFFSRVSGSQWRRSLLGGLAFLLFKGMMKIYLRKSQYIKYSQRTIQNYNPANRPTNLGGSRRLVNSEDESTGESFEAPRDESFDDRDQDDSEEDDENLLGESRTLFSMTIRI